MPADHHADLQLVGQADYALYLTPGGDDIALPPGFSRTHVLSHADALFLTSPIADARLADLLQHLPYLIPVIPLYYGEAEPWMDLPQPLRDPASACALARVILSRTADLPNSVRASTSVEERLLARLYTRQVELRGQYTPTAKHIVGHPAAGPLPGLILVADALTDRGFLQRSFFDRVHICTHCAGERFNVREECVACRSADVYEAPLVHHYKCGHQAVESAFRTPSRFQCPKCGDALRHIGQDYDKPGQVMICRGCASRNDAVAVGFQCLDCLTHYDADQVPTRDYYHYELSALGTAQILLGPVNPATVRAPEQLRVLLRQLLQEQQVFKTPFVVAEVSFTERATLYAENPDNWSRTINLVRDCIHSAIRPVDSAFEYLDTFVVLLPRLTPKQAYLTMQEIGTRLCEVLRYNPGLQTRLLNESELLLLLNEGA